MLGLTFVDPADYDKIQETDTIDILGLDKFTAGVPLKIKLNHVDGSSDVFKVNHTYNKTQIDWFKAGSALNLIKQQNH
jgi:aconitate hydratase